MTLYKADIWESFSGWMVNDNHGNAGYWWHPMRILNLTPEKYIDLLIQYGAKNFRYEARTNVLIFSFETRDKANAFKNFINKKARERNYLC